MRGAGKSIVLGIGLAVGALAPWPQARAAFDVITQSRSVSAEAGPRAGVGVSQMFTAFDSGFFSQSAMAEWTVPDPFAFARGETSQNSELGPFNLSASGQSLATVISDDLQASASSLLRVEFLLLKPTPVVFSAITGGDAIIRLDGPGTSIAVIDSLSILDLTLAPGVYSLLAESRSESLGAGEGAGSFHLALAVVPAPSTAVLIALLGFRFSGRVSQRHARSAPTG